MPTRKDKTNVAPIHREQVFIPANGAVKFIQEFRKRTPRGGNLEIVSPEFDLLTLGKGLFTNLIKPNYPIGNIPIDKNSYYRQVFDIFYDKSNKLGAINDIKNSGIVRTKNSIFNSPMFAKGNIYKGYENKPNTFIIKSNNNKLNWTAVDNLGNPIINPQSAAYTPLYKGSINNTPSKYFDIYKYISDGKYQQIFMNNNKVIPITGLNTISENIDEMKYGGRRKAKLGLGDNNVPTQEEYIAQQIAVKRAAALDKSRNRTSIRVPMIPNPSSKEEWNKRINEYIKFTEELLSEEMALGDIKNAEISQNHLNKLLEERDNGYPSLIYGANCMYNAGDCYGLNIPGNQTFVAKHKELGFKKYLKGSMELGDIVQDVRGGTPIHAMIYDSKDNEGNLLFNYAKGHTNDSAFDINKNYVKQGKYRIPIEDFDVYKYVGIPADSTQWINEYKQKYGNGMRCGGRRKAQLGLDIREGGIAIPIAPNMYYMDGRSHDNGGIAIGPNNKNGLEVEGGEVVKVGNNDIKVFSSVPLLQGVSPAQLVMGGANPNKVFKAQEDFKDRNRINDDGTRYEIGGEKKSNSAIRTEKDKKVSARNRAIYSAVDATADYPTWWQAIGLGIGSNFKTMINPDSMNYTVTDSVADAAWRKRLGLSYNDKFLIPNKDGSVRLPRNVEMEIPTDTTMLKKRIAANEKFANQSNIVGEDWQIVQAMMKKDKEALEALRKTYKTGEPVVVNEYAHNSRKLSKNGELINDAINYKSPLNVMRNYTIQYDPKTRKMNYRDTYDFNEFEWGVPGESFEIKGSIPLKKFGGQDDTKTAALKKLKAKHTIKGVYGGGESGGAGAGSVIMEIPKYVTDTITKRYLVPVTQNFNDAFGDAVNAGLDKFMFDKKWYTTEKGNNPNNNAAGATRTQTVYLPVEHKEVRRRKKEFGGSMIYTINGNIKNGLSLRPKAKIGKEEKIDDKTKIGEDGLVYKRGVDGNWYTDGTVHASRRKITSNKNIKQHSSKSSTPTTLEKVNFTSPLIQGERKKIGNLYYEQNEDGQWKPAANQSSVTTRDSGRPVDFGMTRVGVNHPNGKYTYHPLTGEKINADGTIETEEPSVKGTTKVNTKKSTSSTPRRGESKSATTTTKYKTEPTYINYKPNKVNLAVKADNPTSRTLTKIDTPSTGGGTQSKDGRWVGQYKTTNLGDWIGLGSNLAGSVASYFITKSAIDKMPEPLKPVMAQAAKLKTRYNVEPQLTEIREAEQMNRASVRRNTQSSNTSLAREQRLMNEARGARNTLYGQKENIETQLINQDRLNRQSVMRDSVKAYNEYLNKLTATKTAKNQLKVSNINNLISGLTGSVNNILGNIESRRATNNTLRAIAAANPNVDARLIGGFDYYIDPITKKKYNKNQQYVGTING